MADEVDICNGGLIKLGANTISSLTENSPAARRCTVIYNKIRDFMLRSHFWNFATKRVELAQLVETPAFEYNYQYQLPVDYMRVIKIYNQPNAEYKIEGDKLLTNIDKVQLVYIYKVTDPNKFDPAFTEALSAAIAVELAFAMAADPQLTQLVERQARDLLRKAKTIDSQNGTPMNIQTKTYTSRYDLDPPWDTGN